MLLSSKGRYAITAMMDLALRQETSRVTLADLSRNQGISLSYMEQIFARLRGHGLVEGTRGPSGGYRLSKAPEQITIAEIVNAVDRGQEARKSTQPADMLWKELKGRMEGFLDRITLAELLDRFDPQDVMKWDESVA